ncbi:type II secretion system protein G precursor [bacterium BMS3Abin05]|nr:type II secretion system protein G precursor [bacterium BMS3Abin05]GBE28573.1 type II secretion system protein G precursor [bacterium BMS3Bbin03]HDK36456.1 prepilin-type N-terminal cleavage/methylation domain-containing protein [Bacteroidota bacterium]HDL78607.1 prepilin-type N-terminal cleavage/methylation domain-containing protein [Bacteroidota bacterium]HDZ12585.1 prepilin-type N-terminal cleavage/methylation domain-containing protein [Bacteroidota bacterium]
MFKKLRGEKGFSLAELLIVIAIIGILAGIVVMNMNGSEKSAKAAKLRANLVTMREAILAYKMDHGFYPCTSSDYNSSGNETIFKEQLTWFTSKAGRPSRTKTVTYTYGPYLQSFPEDPVTESSKVVIDLTHERIMDDLKTYVHNSTSAKGGWYYEAKTGQVVVYIGRTVNNDYAYY